MAVLKYLLVLSLLGVSCSTYKILVVFPFPNKSHSILGDGLVRHLLAGSHEVTYITPFPKKNSNPNLQHVDVSQANNIHEIDALNIQVLMDKKINVDDQDFFHQMIINTTANVIKDTTLRNFLDDSKQKFDAVIIERMFSDVYSGFAAVFDCPLIWFFPFEDVSAILPLVDEYPNPAYTPNYRQFSGLPYSFTQRFLSLWHHAKGELLNMMFYEKDHARVYEGFEPFVSKRGRALPLFEEQRFNISLALINSHISVGLPLKRPYSYINIGGYHIDTAVKPLPEDLKKIMDNAKDGVIYFSMGSNLQSKYLPESIKKGLIKMFGGLKQTVLWKFEEVLPELPKNVHILKWAPQPSILAHPNCVLFITHGGLLSTTETVHFGVPAIGIPVFGDQFQNVKNAALKGYMKKVDLSYSLVEDLKAAVNEMVNQPRYMERAKELSMIYHDRPVSPGAELVHWVEHVVRTRGAKHLRSPALELAFYERMYLDLIALLVGFLFILRTMIQYLLAVSKQRPEKKKNN